MTPIGGYPDKLQRRLAVFYRDREIERGFERAKINKHNMEALPMIL
jgi:hypothetical protein